MKIRVIGTGSAFPGRSVDNREIAEKVDSSDSWIQERTGICSRYIAENETTASMAAEAAAKALELADISGTEVDLIVTAVGSAEQYYPAIACEVQAAIGAVHAGCFDINAACSGFITAFQTAYCYMASGLARTVLVIGTEHLSQLVDWTDRGTCILFGDGAGAVVLQADEEQMVSGNDTDRKVRQENRDGCQAAETHENQERTHMSPVFVLHADGTGGHLLTCKTGGYIRMDGRAIYQFAVRKVPEVIREVLSKAALKPEDVDYFILHQANRRIIESIAARMKLPMDRFPVNIADHGNISSACIPVLLDELNRSGQLKPGMKLVMAGFGAGLTWGSICLEW